MAELYADQAAGLRRLFAREPLRVITFAAGSHGVGKSVLVANVAACLAQQGRTVLVLDECTKRNVAACFGVSNRLDLLHVINRERSLSEVLQTAAPGVLVLPAAKAVKKLGKFDESQQSVLTSSLSAMEDPVDVILVDASQDHPLGFSPLGLAAHETVIVMSPTPASITDAYALIKKVSLGYARRNYRVLVNGVRGMDEGRSVFGNIARVTHSRRFARLEFAGSVPLDERLHHAASLCKTVGTLYPDTPAAKAIRTLASDMLAWKIPDDDSGGLEQFVQQLLHLSQHIDPVAIYA